jgi:hypothetical protein
MPGDRGVNASLESFRVCSSTSLRGLPLTWIRSLLHLPARGAAEPWFARFLRDGTGAQRIAARGGFPRKRLCIAWCGNISNFPRSSRKAWAEGSPQNAEKTRMKNLSAPPFLVSHVSGVQLIATPNIRLRLIAIFLLLSKSSFQLLGRLFPIGRLVTVDMAAPT